MTAQQEIDYIRAVKQDIQGMYCWQKEINKSLDTAILAISKQIPRKVIRQRNSNDIKIGNVTFTKGVTTYKCPECKNWLTGTETYCCFCGQKLDI